MKFEVGGARRCKIQKRAFKEWLKINNVRTHNNPKEKPKSCLYLKNKINLILSE